MIEDDRVKDLIWYVAQGHTYDSEYDGRNYTYCKHCDCCLSEMEKHEEDCQMIVAREILGDKWLEYEKEVAAKGDDELTVWKVKRKICQFCGKRIAEGTGMQKHLKTNTKCLTLQLLKKEGMNFTPDEFEKMLEEGHKLLEDCQRDFYNNKPQN